MTFNYLYYGSYFGEHEDKTGGLFGLQGSAGTSVLYDFTDAYFSVSRSLTNGYSSTTHRYGPTQAQVRSWLSGTSNGGGGHSWANTYVDVPTDGYQRWTIPKTGTYRISARGAHAGYSDSPYDYMRGSTVQADYDLVMGEKLIIAVGQGVPNYQGDHCNGASGASWVAYGNDIATAIMLLVGAGAGGDTSDGSTKTQNSTNLNRTVTNIGGATGVETTPINTNASQGYGATNGTYPNSGGYLSAGSSVGSSSGGGFRSGNLIGGAASNSTAGNGGFGGASGGKDEYGSAGGGFTGAYGQDNTSTTGHGSSFVNTQYNCANYSCNLNSSTTTWQDTDYKSATSYQGRVYVQLL